MRHRITEPIYAVGDIHGRTKALAEAVQAHGIRRAALILMGDVGLGFAGDHAGPCPRLEALAAATENRFYLFRGNHDNPASFTDHKAETEGAFPHITLLNDFDEVEDADGRVGLIIGGGLSLDRRRRALGYNYWQNEPIDYRYVPARHYDFILSHSGITPPSAAEGSSALYHMMLSDPALEGDLEEEQAFFRRMEEAVQPRFWLNAHFHFHEAFTTPRGTRVTALDINEILPLPR